MPQPETKLRGRWAVAFVVGLLGLVLAIVMLFRLGFSSPHLVGAAIPVNETELLLLTSPVNRRPAWVVYGLDGKPRRPWGSQPLPGGIVEEPTGALRGPEAEIEPRAIGMSRLAPGQSQSVRGLLPGQVVRFQDPVGTLVESSGPECDRATKVCASTNDERRLERVSDDGSTVWSQSPSALLGELDFKPAVTELRHVHLRDDGKTLVLVIQAYTSYSARPVDAAVARIVLVDAATGRVSSRTDIARPPS